MVKRKTIEDVYELCNEIGLVCKSTEYKGVKEKLTFVCTECGEDFYRSFDNLQTRKSTICDKCGKNHGTRKQAHIYDYVKEFIERHGCNLISKEYKNTDSKLKIQCSCGEIFETTFYKFDKRDKKQCSKCGLKKLSNSLLTPIEEIKDYVESHGYNFINREHNQDTRKHIITVSCDKGHQPYNVSYHKFKHGRRCPFCSSSNGEQRINKYLTQKNIEFSTEYIFEDLLGTGGAYLRFDFAILSNNSLLTLIEFDGKQHFEPVEIFGGEEKFKENVIHDEIKNNYCKEKKINLIRIPYWEINQIENILDNELQLT